MIDNYLDILKLISDTGLLILIWLVQLIIYPSFRHTTIEKLIIWHPIYTTRITTVVLPLMLSQIILSGLLVFNNEWRSYYFLDFILVLATWILTFTVFVPLHQKIDNPHTSNKFLFAKKLVQYNWIRTLLWTIISILTFSNVILI